MSINLSAKTNNETDDIIQSIVPDSSDNNAEKKPYIGAISGVKK